MLLETRGGLQREKHELETTGSSHARGKPASTWKATQVMVKSLKKGVFYKEEIELLALYRWL